MKVIYIDIDTLRRDHMSCYGYGRTTTPNMDEIANEAVLLNRCYSSDAPCLPSRAALISGMFGIHNGAVGHGGTAADRRLTGIERGFRDQFDTNNFTNLFRKAGMYTASISTFAERHSSMWFNAGFNETINVGGCGMESGEEVLPVVLDWIKRNESREDWYLHFHLWDPHTPYRAPESFGKPFENTPLVDDWINDDVLKLHKQLVGPHGANEINMYNSNTNPKYPRHPGKLTTLKDVKSFIDEYDTGILYADYLVGQVMDQLKKMGIFDEVAFIISSDHGENMGELGIYGEHATADHPTCNIPMIIKWNGCKKGVFDNNLHYNLDLVPTVADLLNIKHYSKWDGKSFASLLTDGNEETGHNFLVISQNSHVCQRSVVFDDYIYIRTYHCGFHLFDDEMLFNIKEDPNQTINLIEDKPEIAAKATRLYLKWYDEAMKKSDSQIDPLWTVMKEGGPAHTRSSLDDYVNQLMSTGREEGAKILKEKYGK